MARVFGYQEMESLGILGGQIRHHVHATVALKVVVMTKLLLGDLLFLRHRLKLNHCQVTTRLERAVLIEDIGDATRHAGREIAAGASKHHDDAAGHIFAAMVAGALDDRNGPGIADGEAFTGHAAEIALAFDCAVKHRVSDDNRFFRHNARIGRRPDDQSPTRKTLAYIIVGVAVELESDASREPGTEALPGRAGEANMNGVFRQAFVAESLCDFSGKHAATRAIGVVDGRLQSYRRAPIECGL